MLELLAVKAVEKNLSKASDVLTTEGLKESLKRRNTEKNAVSDGRASITQYTNQRLMDKMDEIDVPEEYAKIALINELETIVNKRSILDKIFGRSKIILQAIPQDNTNPDNDIGEISEDWLNRFRESACEKSSEEAQELFSKVLAGEIRKPGSISLRALTTLADMEQKVAQPFKTFCSLCLVNLDDPKKYTLTQSKSDFEIIDARIPYLTGSINDIGILYSKVDSLKRLADMSQSIYKSYGLTYSALKLLIEYDLIEATLDTNYYENYGAFWCDNEIWGILKPESNSLQSLEDLQNIPISGYGLTSIGRELFYITKLDTPPQYFEELMEFLHELFSIKFYKYPKPQKKSTPDGSTDPTPTNA